MEYIEYNVTTIPDAASGMSLNARVMPGHLSQWSRASFV